MSQPSPPVVVTGIARAGTSWVGKMLEANGEFVYINEPLNPRHPPGRSPGILRAPVPHEYVYITDENEAVYLAAFRDTFAFRYHAVDEIRQNHTPFDVLKMAKYLTSFTLGRVRGKRPMLNDPYATLAAGWLVRRFAAPVVVVVRQPAAIVASYRRMGYRVALADLADQPLFVRDWLEPFRADVEAALRAPDDLVGQVSVLWRVLHHVVAETQRRTGALHVVRHEDLSLDPVGRYSALYAALGLDFTEQVRRAVVEGASGTSKARSHSWRLSRTGTLSRTAFRPMASRANLDAWRSALTPDEVARVRSLTEDVAGAYYGDEDWGWLVGEPEARDREALQPLPAFLGHGGVPADDRPG